MKSRLFFTLILSFLSLCATSRTTCTIDNGWMFIRQDVPGAEAVNFAANGWQRVNLPHCWNVEDTEDEPYGYYRGIGWYRKSLHLDDIAGQRVFLRFEAANLVADVWVNGVSAGAQHRGGYTPFVFDITDKVHSGDNVIAVKVNNAFNADVPPLDADFTFFGGIYRDVSIIVTPASHFDLTQGNGVFITTPVVAAKSSQVAVKSVVVSDRKNGLYVRHSILDADNRLVASTKVRLKNGVAGEAMMSVANPVLWDVDNPYLYSVLSEVVDKNDSVIDCVRNPLGIRTFKFDAKQGFFLNGRHLKLLGVNRHQDYPNRGNALPDELHRADMKLMKESGINCLRISHYPHDESVLEMCDRYGFICFEECPLINRITVTPEYEADSKSQITEMIKRDFNHPSIVAWNSSNEINITYVNMKDSVARKEYGKKLSAFLGDLNDLIHSLDATRPSMIVLCYEPEMNDAAGFHKADIIAYNKYYGWYEGKIADLSTLVDRIHRLQPDKPVFISEFGSGADVRIHSFHPVLYDHSEEFQLDWFKQSLKTILQRNDVCGGTIWHFEEFHSESRGDVIPHVNEKSLVTRNRVPKASYYYIKSLMSKVPFISIPSQCWKVRGGREDSEGAGVCTQPFEVFANTAQVELLLNGKSLGVKDVNEHCTTFNVPFVNGSNLLVLRTPDGTAQDDFLKLDFTVQPFKLNSGKFSEIAVNCGSQSYVNDASCADYLWYPDSSYIPGYFGHVGGHYFSRTSRKILSSDQNINGTSLDPVYQTQLIGLDGYRFDVRDGQYEVSLLFADLDPKTANVFDVSLNGDKVLRNFDVKSRFGSFNAVRIRYIVNATHNSGIRIDFTPVKGSTFVNGIVVRQVY